MGRVRQALIALLAAIALVQTAVSADDEAKKETSGKDHDNTADGKKSLGGSGELIHFSVPQGKKIAGIKIHGSRYGLPDAPDEDFLVYVLDEEGKEVLSTQRAPYSLFKRGAEKWVNVRFKKPVEVPSDFWICLDFRPHQTKGVYVSYDTSSGGKHSKIGLPGQEPKDVDFGGDWMVELVPVKK
jgi:hypothetical protein